MNFVVIISVLPKPDFFPCAIHLEIENPETSKKLKKVKEKRDSNPINLERYK